MTPDITHAETAMNKQPFGLYKPIDPFSSESKVQTLPKDFEERFENEFVKGVHGLLWVTREDANKIKRFLVKELSLAHQAGKSAGKAEEREQIANDFGEFRKISPTDILGRVKWSKTLRYYLLPHTKYKEGDDDCTI